MQETIKRIESAVEYILNADQDATITLENCHQDWKSVEIRMADLPATVVVDVSVFSFSDILNKKATDQLIVELKKQLPRYLW